MRRVLASLLAWSVAVLASASPQAPPSAEQEAADGIRQVTEGDFEAAVITLDSAVRRLEGQPGRDPLLLQALVQLGVALVGLDQTEAASARFRRALAIDPRLRLRPDTFSPKVIGVFEQERREMEAQKGEPATGGGVGKPLLFVGLGATAAAVALAVRGGEGAEPSSGATLSNARFVPPAIVCPDGTNDVPIAFIVLGDVTAGTETFVIDRAVLDMTITSSPALPSEVGFISNREATPTPGRVVAGTTATVRIDGTLLCGNAPGGPARYNEWTARVTLRPPSGAALSTTTLPPPLRVDLP